MPYKDCHKQEVDRNKVNLTKAEDLALQTAKANQSFLDKSRAAAKNKPRNAGKEQWTSGKEDPKKPSGEGRKFYDDNGVELKGNAKRYAYTSWQRSEKAKAGRVDKWQKDKWSGEKWKKDKWQS